MLSSIFLKLERGDVMLYNKRKIQNMRVPVDFIYFWKPHQEWGIFSQWYMSSFTDGIRTYSCAEQYMMAQKAILMGDMEILDKIMRCDSPKKMKDLGRQVRNFNPTIWDEEKYNIVLRASILKFSQNEELKNLLFSTGNRVLVEASPYDDIWGIKMDAALASNTSVLEWNGENLLGFALMEARSTLRVLEKPQKIHQIDVIKHFWKRSDGAYFEYYDIINQNICEEGSKLVTVANTFSEEKCTKSVKEVMAVCLINHYMEEDIDYDYEDNMVVTNYEEDSYTPIYYCPVCGAKFVINCMQEIDESIEMNNIWNEYEALSRKRNSQKKRKEEYNLYSQMFNKDKPWAYISEE